MSPYMDFPVVLEGKESATMWETQVRYLGQEDPLEKEMETHSSTLAWKIPWTEKPGRLQSMELQRVGHNWMTIYTSEADKASSCNSWAYVPQLERSLVYCNKRFCMLQQRPDAAINKLIKLDVHAQSCLSLYNPMDYNTPGSSVLGIFQARVLEWVSISFSRGSSCSRNQTRVSCVSCVGQWIILPLRHLGTPTIKI